MDKALSEALTVNLRNAVLCGLILSEGDSCTEEELYWNITNISYQGIVYTRCISTVFFTSSI